MTAGAAPAPKSRKTPPRPAARPPLQAQPDAEEGGHFTPGAGALPRGSPDAGGQRGEGPRPPEPKPGRARGQGPAGAEAVSRQAAGSRSKKSADGAEGRGEGVRPSRT